LKIHSTAFEPTVPKYYSSKMNMTTKDSSRKHVMVPILEDNSNILLQLVDIYINIINRQLLNAKSYISIDCICPFWNGIIFTTNKVARASDLIVIEKYLKNLENINSNNNLIPCLL